MIDAKQMQRLFEKLNDGLQQAGEIGEIGIVGGAVMCLVYNARQSTRDVDAIFHPGQTIRNLAKSIAREEDLPEDWLHDAAKAYVQGDFARENILNLSHLRVWAPEPRYMLAMKCMSARVDTSDGDDIRFLIHLLKLKEAQQVFDIIQGYYPKSQIEAKTQFFVEELFE